MYDKGDVIPRRSPCSSHGPVNSFRQLAQASGVSHQQIINIVSGRTKTPKATTTARLGEALGVDAATIDRWVKVSTGANEPWTPPESSARLTPRQRNALTELIMSIVDPHAADAATKPDLEGFRRLVTGLLDGKANGTGSRPPNTKNTEGHH